MTLSKKVLIRLFTLCFIAMSFVQCQKEDIDSPNDPNEPAKTGQVNFQMTDAPIDNASVEGVFITVAEVKIDGESYDGFSGKQTIDIMAYQNGNVKALGLSELETGSYSNVTLVLDYETDAQGNAPGCYVLTTDQVKESLATTSGEAKEEITVAHNFVVEEGQRTDIVMDFDLRKTITAQEDSNGEWDFSFVSDSELQSGVRVVNENETGTIEGTCSENNPLVQSDKIVVYAYAKGEYSSDTEMHGQGTSNIEFAKAVTSAEVDTNGNYQLSFLNEGEYELVFASYEEDNEGNFTLKGQLQLDVNLGINLQSVSVNANSSTSVVVDVIGILPL